MKQKITNEKFKNVNEFKNEMFNVKNVSLMKKQVFTLVMMLALIVGAGVSAIAQTGDGLIPTDPKEIAIGASGTFTITPGLGTNTFLWDVYEVTIAAITADPGMALVTSVAASKATIATSTAATTLVTFYAAQVALSMFVVQCTETDGSGCFTIRRFYVSIFNFDIEVIALGINPGTAPAAPADWATAAAQADCNTWSGTVVANSTLIPAVDPLDGTAITTPHASYFNNEGAGGVAKVTESWFAVRITLTGAILNNFMWRLQYSLPGSGMSLYEISTAEAGVTFGGTTTDTWRAATESDVLTTPTVWAAGVFNTDQTIYVAKRIDGAATATYVFKVITHNNLNTANMVYAVNIDRVQLEKGDLTSPTAYNNGEKLLAANASLVQAQLDGTRDVSATTTISQSPATSVIGITE